MTKADSSPEQPPVGTIEEASVTTIKAPAPTVNAKELFSNIYTKSLSKNAKLSRGLANLNSLPEFSEKIPPVAGKPFTQGYMAFRQIRSKFSLAIACGTAQVRYLDFEKFIAMVENLHDNDSSTIMLQNFQDQENNNSAKGQILGRINPKSSAIHIIQGLTGRIIRNPSDISLFDVYYIDRTELTSYYLAAKSQIHSSDLLESMIATYDGWKAFHVPLDPLDPFTI